jgi:hypothetical protein
MAYDFMASIQENENEQKRRQFHIDPFPSKEEHWVEIVIMSMFWLIFWSGFFGGIIYLAIRAIS